MKSFVKNLLTKIKVSKNVKTSILNNLKILLKSNKKEINNLFKSYKDIDFDFECNLNNFYKIIGKTTLNKYQIDLLYVLLLCKNLKKLYIENGYSLNTYFSTLEDIKYKIEECILVKGVVGIFVVNWYKNFFKMKTFKLGRLEYELTEFGLDYKNIKSNGLSLSIHIPRTGERLDANLVDESLELAKIFFGKLFINNKFIFKCSSWLLSPLNKEILSESSNIIQFANRFKIIKVTNFDNYSELWRIFDSEFVDVEHLKGTSTLTRGYIDIVKNCRKISSGFGFFILN